MWSGSECPCSAVQRPHGALGDYCRAVCPAPGPAWRDFSRHRGPCSAAFLSHFPQGDSGSPGAGQIVRLSASGSSVCARVSAPRSPAATAAGTREARQGRSREVPSPSSAASARRGLQSSLGTAPGTRPRSPSQRRVLSRRLQVSSQSALRARWLPARLPARAARRGGTARGLEAGGRKEGCPLWGWRRRGEAAARAAPMLQAAPQFGTLVSLPVCCQPHSPGASLAPVGWSGL